MTFAKAKTFVKVSCLKQRISAFGGFVYFLSFPGKFRVFQFLANLFIIWIFPEILNQKNTTFLFYRRRRNGHWI